MSQRINDMWGEGVVLCACMRVFFTVRKRQGPLREGSLKGVKIDPMSPAMAWSAFPYRARVKAPTAQVAWLDYSKKKGTCGTGRGSNRACMNGFIKPCWLTGNLDSVCTLQREFSFELYGGSYIHRAAIAAKRNI